MMNSSVDFMTNPYSASSGSTKLSACSKDTLKCVSIKLSTSDDDDDNEVDGDDDDDIAENDDKFVDDCESGYRPADYLFPSGEFRHDEEFHDHGEFHDDGEYRVGKEISSSSSTVDVKDKLSSAMMDSDDATDADTGYESSKRLIEKKRRNRRSAGDELERSTRHPLMLSPTPADRHDVGNVNRRSW